jgi:hypothetical protein
MNHIRICRVPQGTAEHGGMCRVPLILRLHHRRIPLQGGGIVGPRLLTNLALPCCPQPHTCEGHGVLDLRSSIRASGVDLLGRSAFHTSPLITKSVVAM